MSNRHASNSKAEPIALLGGGGHAAVVAEAAFASGLRVAGFFDDDPQAECLGLDRLGAVSDARDWSRSEGGRLHLAIGDIRLRAEIATRLDEPRWATITAASAVVSPSASIEDGVFVGASAVVNARAAIAPHAIINTAAIVEHDASVGFAAHVAPRVTLCGAASVGSRSLVGAGAIVLPGITVGDGAVIGAGSVVRDHVPDNVIAVGVPARVLSAVQ